MHVVHDRLAAHIFAKSNNYLYFQYLRLKYDSWMTVKISKLALKK